MAKEWARSADRELFFFLAWGERREGERTLLARVAEASGDKAVSLAELCQKIYVKRSALLVRAEWKDDLRSARARREL